MGYILKYIISNSNDLTFDENPFGENFINVCVSESEIKNSPCVGEIGK